MKSVLFSPLNSALRQCSTFQEQLQPTSGVRSEAEMWALWVGGAVSAQQGPVFISLGWSCWLLTSVWPLPTYPMIAAVHQQEIQRMQCQTDIMGVLPCCAEHFNTKLNWIQICTNILQENIFQSGAEQFTRGANSPSLQLHRFLHLLLDVRVKLSPSADCRLVIILVRWHSSQALNNRLRSITALQSDFIIKEKKDISCRYLKLLIYIEGLQLNFKAYLSPNP